jgi:hypothetical protein
MENGDCNPESEVAGREDDHSLPSSIGVERIHCPPQSEYSTFLELDIFSLTGEKERGI